MAWTNLPTAEGSYSLNGNIMANSLGSTMDDILDEADSINSALSAAIASLESDTQTNITGLGVDFSPTLDTITAFSPPSVPTVPALADAPDDPDALTAFNVVVPTAPTPAATPTAPGTSTTLLDDAAYTGAFALARNAALAQEQRDRWLASEQAAANGIGLPSAASQAMLQQSAAARQQATQRAALEQATLKANHLREDKRWAYEFSLTVWSAVEQNKLALYREAVSAWRAQVEKWVQDNTLALSITSQELQNWQVVQQTTLARLQSEIAILQQKLASEAQKLQWKQDKNATELDRAKFDTESAIKIQEFATTIGQQALLAYAGALAEQFKAWLAAVHYTVGASGSINNLSYAGS